MIHARKIDEAAIRAHIDTLAKQPWLGPDRSWWPKCLVRFDEIESAARILNSGEFLSRATAKAQGVMLHDSAHASVIAGTSEHWKRYVRFYFRPRTPTQYANEGFRCASEKGAAHCPVPIVFLLDAADVLTRRDAEYSDGNLGASSWKVRTGSDARFLDSIPWPDVYHNSWVTPDEKSRIVLHRHAEVMVPERLDLEPVRFVGCRSQAEYETLWQLLDGSARERWKPRMGLGTKASLHFRNWMFVDQVTMAPRAVTFHFNPSCATRGPFEARAVITLPNGQRLTWQGTRDLPETFAINIPSDMPPNSTLELTIDGRLAYRNQYKGRDLVF